jgi:hypothetical protein
MFDSIEAAVIFCFLVLAGVLTLVIGLSKFIMEIANQLPSI